MAPTAAPIGRGAMEAARLERLQGRRVLVSEMRQVREGWLPAGAEVAVEVGVRSGRDLRGDLDGVLLALVVRLLGLMVVVVVVMRMLMGVWVRVGMLVL